MKILLVLITIPLVGFIGFLLGGEFFGHHYSESESETIEFEKGKIKRVYGHDYCGFEMLDPGASWIEFTDVGYRALLFSVDRGFQESTPFVKELKAEGNQVSWEDGIYRYALTIENIEDNATEPGGTGQSH